MQLAHAVLHYGTSKIPTLGRLQAHSQEFLLSHLGISGVVEVLGNLRAGEVSNGAHEGYHRTATTCHDFSSDLRHIEFFAGDGGAKSRFVTPTNGRNEGDLITWSYQLVVSSKYLIHRYSVASLKTAQGRIILFQTFH